MDEFDRHMDEFRRRLEERDKSRIINLDTPLECRRREERFGPVRFVERKPEEAPKQPILEEAPAECCPYPYPFDDLGVALYPPTDLPDEILDTFLSATLYHYTSPMWSDYAFSETGDDSGSNITYATPFDGNWLSTGGSLPVGCLIEAVANRADKFSDTFSVSTGGTITRDPMTSLCIWTGGGNTLDYGISNAYKWSLNGVAKSGNQNDPTSGNYGGVTLS